MLIFSGVSTTDRDSIEWENDFEEVMEDESGIVLESRKTFRHEEGDLSFDYKYLIQVMDMDVLTGDCEGDIVINLYMVPKPTDLVQERLDDIKYTIGMEGEGDDVVSYRDVLEEGLAVSFGTQTLNACGQDVPLYEVEGMEDTLRAIAGVYESVNGMRGFYLDMAWNRIGTTGWDLIKHGILGTDLFSF